MQLDGGLLGGMCPPKLVPIRPSGEGAPPPPHLRRMEDRGLGGRGLLPPSGVQGAEPLRVTTISEAEGDYVGVQGRSPAAGVEGAAAPTKFGRWASPQA